MSVSSFKPPKDVNEEGDDDGSRSEGGTPRGGADLPIDEVLRLHETLIKG